MDHIRSGIPPANLCFCPASVLQSSGCSEGAGSWLITIPPPLFNSLLLQLPS